ncbi:MAG: single-stranded DNA-binding protein [Porticoccus sp.]|nr:single-stranded DNA-binding protein [Porticoccus sp.]
MKIEFKTTETETFSGISKKTGNPFSMTKQVGWLHGKDSYPVKVEFLLKDGQSPYAPGMHLVDLEKSVFVDRNNRIAINAVLIPAAQKAAA